MKRPPLAVIFVAVLVIALGETAGAVISQLRPQIDRYARARVAANAQAHGLTGATEYDEEVTARAVYVAEAGLSFFHTHAQGLGPIVIFASTVAATLVPWARGRAVLCALFAIGGLFPLGYLIYSFAALERGRDAGVELAEQYVLTPLGSAAILGLLALAGLIAAGRGEVEAAKVTEPEAWRVPPLPTLLTAILLVACAEIGGASMVKFKLELTRWARGTMLAHPVTHGLVGVRDVDEQVIDEALVKFDGGLRLFHLHAEGMGLVIIAATMTAVTLVGSVAARRAIIALFTVGGAGYPLGYLLWSGLIPYYGVETGKAVAERVVWIPFGGAAIAAAWWLTVLLGMRLVRRT